MEFSVTREGLFKFTGIHMIQRGGRGSRVTFSFELC